MHVFAVVSLMFRRRIVSIRSACAGVRDVGVSSHPNTRNASSAEASRAEQRAPTETGSGRRSPRIQSLTADVLTPARFASSVWFQRLLSI